MPVVSRLIRLIWGGEIDRALRPVLAVGLAGSIAGSSAFPFLGIWAIKYLHASQSQLAFAFLGGAVLAGVIGYAGGHWSDHIGRRPLILAGWGSRRSSRWPCSRSGNARTVGLVPARAPAGDRLARRRRRPGDGRRPRRA